MVKCHQETGRKDTRQDIRKYHLEKGVGLGSAQVRGGPHTSLGFNCFIRGITLKIT